MPKVTADIAIKSLAQTYGQGKLPSIIAVESTEVPVSMTRRRLRFRIHDIYLFPGGATPAQSRSTRQAPRRQLI